MSSVTTARIESFPKLSLANNCLIIATAIQRPVAEIKMCTMAPTTAFIKIIGRNRHALMTHSMALLLPEASFNPGMYQQNSYFTALYQTLLLFKQF
jgi:hypothetical protein